MQLGLHRMGERLRVWAYGIGFHASSRGPSYEGRGVLQNSPLDPPSFGASVGGDAGFFLVDTIRMESDYKMDHLP